MLLVRLSVELVLQDVENDTETDHHGSHFCRALWHSIFMICERSIAGHFNNQVVSVRMVVDDLSETSRHNNFAIVPDLQQKIHGRKM